MRLTILGGASIAGQRFIRQALRHGYCVTVLDPLAKLSLRHKNLTVVPGLLQSEADIMRAMRGSHAVIGMFDDALYDMGLVISCMYASGLRRIIVDDNLKQTVGESDVVSILQQTSLDWTVVHSMPITMIDTELGDEQSNFAVSIGDFTKFMIHQITDVTHLQSAVVLSN